MEAYFVETMELAAAKDGQSRKVLRMIRDSIVYDIALLDTADGTWWGRHFYDYLLNLDVAVETKFGSTVNQGAVEEAALEIELVVDRFKYPEMPED